MKAFVARYGSWVTAILSGFDRIVFRGRLLPLIRRYGMFSFLESANVPLLDFREYVLGVSERVKKAALADAVAQGRPVVYLASSRASKEETARKLLKQHPLTGPGLIGILKVVEPCMSFEYHRSADVRERGLRLCPQKCLHLYRYEQHPDFGFMHTRLQTWFPFEVQIYLNGREWLAQTLMAQGSGFERMDNCFVRLEDAALAQRLLDEQLTTEWSTTLSTLARAVNPLHDEIFASFPMEYYWSAYQTEWATDLMFESRDALAQIYPALTRHALLHFHSPDVMRFLGRKPHPNFQGEVVSSYKERLEGVRVKHWVRGNSVKMYDKAGQVLRVETTIARTDDFKVYRPVRDEPDGQLAWLRLRKGVADLHRRAEVSQRSNERYLDALAVVDDTTPCSRLFDAVSRPVADNGRRFRALRIGDPDELALLESLSRGEFATAGFRNRDLRQLLHPASATASKTDQRRLSAQMSRKLRLLRAHGIIKKIQKTNRYQLTQRGHLLTAALHATRNANIKQLLQQAA